MAKPAFMKITKMVATRSQRLFAKNAALSSGSSAAWAERLKRPRPIKAMGTQASQVSVRLEERPRILRNSSSGASNRLASCKLLGRRREVGEATVIRIAGW